MGGIPFQVYAALPGRGECSVPETIVHGPADSVYPGCPALTGEVYFREDQIQRRRGIPGRFPDLFPIAPVLGKLIAGDNRPFFHIYPPPGKQDIRYFEAETGQVPVNIFHEYALYQIFRIIPILPPGPAHINFLLSISFANHINYEEK
jgi:hypothetical protein